MEIAEARVVVNLKDQHTLSRLKNRGVKIEIMNRASVTYGTISCSVIINM